MINLLKDESIISESKDKSVILTNYRICLHLSSQGNLYRQHIVLEHVTSTEVTKSSNFILLVLAIIVATIGVTSFLIGEANNTQSTALLIIALILFAFYYLTRKKTIIVSSPSTKMKIIVNQMSNDVIFDFVNKLDDAIVNKKR